MIALYLAPEFSTIPFIVSIYVLAHIFFALFDKLFVSKLEKMKSVISTERSLFLFAINALEIIIAFAIFYRVLLCFDFYEALFNSLTVFGTVGHPIDSNLSEAQKYYGRIIVGAELACDFLFVAVFLGAFIGGLRPRPATNNIRRKR